MSSNPESLTAVNGLLFFIADDSIHGRELWQTDGTEEGTVLVGDIWPGRTQSGIKYLTAVGNSLHFTASDSIHGTELWGLDVNTGVGDEVGSIISGYTLYNNYPNPFNPSTEISFTLKVANQVLLEIYDLNGRVITTLLNERRPAGRSSATWVGDGYSSGIYFYKLTVEMYTETKKMILLK